MYGDCLIEGLHVLSSGLLDGCCCRVGKRIDVDNIARQLVVVDANFDGMTRQTGIQRALSDVVQAAFDGNEELIMDVLQDIFLHDVIQIRQTHELGKYVWLLDQFVVNDEILFAVAVIICDFQIHF